MEKEHDKWKCDKCQTCYEYKSRLDKHISKRHAEMENVVDRMKNMI